MMQRNNLNPAQYEFVRKLLQCGHAYATIDCYDSAFRLALDKMTQAENNAEQDGWRRVCTVILEMAVLLFGQEGERHLTEILKNHPK